MTEMQDRSVARLLRRELEHYGVPKSTARAVAKCLRHREPMRVDVGVYVIGDMEWWVATSLDGLDGAIREHSGYAPEEMWDKDWRDDTRRLPDDEPLTLWMPTLEAVPDGADVEERQHESNADWKFRITASARAWAEATGVGMLGSTEF